MTEDPRLTRARAIFAPFAMLDAPHPAAQAGLDLLAFAEERLRINIGLLAENTELKRRLSSGETLVLHETPRPDIRFIEAARAVLAAAESHDDKGDH